VIEAFPEKTLNTLPPHPHWKRPQRHQENMMGTLKKDTPSSRNSIYTSTARPSMTKRKSPSPLVPLQGQCSGMAQSSGRGNQSKHHWRTHHRTSCHHLCSPSSFHPFTNFVNEFKARFCDSDPSAQLEPNWCMLQWPRIWPNNTYKVSKSTNGSVDITTLLFAKCSNKA